MKELLEKGFNNINAASKSVINGFTTGFSTVSEVVNGLPVFITFQHPQITGKEKFDEKHYFVIPLKTAEMGVALHTMRCLPKGFPEINDLPKRRIFHFSNANSEALLTKILVDQSKEIVVQENSNNLSALESLANDIDVLDQKLTYGMLMLGGVATLVNPVIGVGIAAKAIFPGAVGLLSKYSLRPIGEKITETQLKKQIKTAEQKILKDFKSATTLQIVNPILQELELTLNTTEYEHDPLIDFDLGNTNIPILETDYWRELTNSAIFHVYKDIIKQPDLHKSACLGSEDIRWLRTVFAAIE